MKSNIYKLFLALFIMLVSCDEDEFLKETPFSFYAPENSYQTPEQMEATIGILYNRARVTYHHKTYNPDLLQSGTDLFYRAAVDIGTNNRLAYITPQNVWVQRYWTDLYKLIFDANVITSRIVDVEFNNESDRNRIDATARFFRATAYRILGSLWGGVPLVLEEPSGPVRNFERATREQVWQQCVTDLTFASQHLPAWDGSLRDGEISKACADHLLTEIYINLQEWDNAIAAASAVIDDPNYELMTERFGVWPDEIADDQYNPFWDLFRRGNQNRSSGNKEAIWVFEYEY